MGVCFFDLTNSLSNCNHIKPSLFYLGHKTDIVCHKFQNKTLLIITQYGKIANVVTVHNQVFNGAATNKQKVFEIQPKLGNVSDETEGAIRYLMNYLKCTDLVVSLGLKTINKDILIELRNELGKIDCLKWNVLFWIFEWNKLDKYFCIKRDT